MRDKELQYLNEDINRFYQSIESYISDPDSFNEGFGNTIFSKAAAFIQKVGQYVQGATTQALKNSKKNRENTSKQEGGGTFRDKLKHFQSLGVQIQIVDMYNRNTLTQIMNDINSIDFSIEAYSQSFTFDFLDGKNKEKFLSINPEEEFKKYTKGLFQYENLDESIRNRYRKSTFTLSGSDLAALENIDWAANQLSRTLEGVKKDLYNAGKKINDFMSQLNNDQSDYRNGAMLLNNIIFDKAKLILKLINTLNTINASVGEWEFKATSYVTNPERSQLKSGQVIKIGGEKPTNESAIFKYTKFI